MSSILRLDRLRQFIGELATLLDSRPDESTLLAQAHPLLAELVHQDDWLPEDCARPDPQRYQRTCCMSTHGSASRWSASSGGRARSHRYTIIGSGA